MGHQIFGKARVLIACLFFGLELASLRKTWFVSRRLSRRESRCQVRLVNLVKAMGSDPGQQQGLARKYATPWWVRTSLLSRRHGKPVAVLELVSLRSRWILLCWSITVVFSRVPRGKEFLTRHCVAGSGNSLRWTFMESLVVTGRGRFSV